MGHIVPRAGSHPTKSPQLQTVHLLAPSAYPTPAVPTQLLHKLELLLLTITSEPASHSVRPFPNTFPDTPNPPLFLRKHPFIMATQASNGDGPVGQEKINTDIITLTRFLTEEQVKVKEATGDFT